MAAVTQMIPSYLGGVSKQTDKKKLPGQVRECLNAYPDPTFGLRKRPGFKYIKNIHTSADPASPDFANAKWFFIKRDDGETYIGCILNTGTERIKIWNANGTACHVTYPDGVDYLDTTSDYYDILTVQDNSVITNKTKVVAQLTPEDYILGSKGTIRLFQVKYACTYSSTITVDGTAHDVSHTTIDQEAVPPAGPGGSMVNTAANILTELETAFNALTLPGDLTITKLESTLELDLVTPVVTEDPTNDGGSGGTDGTYENLPTTTTKSKIVTLGPPSAADPARVQDTYTIGVDDYTTSGTGSDATFSVDIDAVGAATITLVDAGKSFALNEDITISGNFGGGADLTFQVTAIGAGAGLTVDVVIEGNVATKVTANTGAGGYFKDDEITVTAFTGSTATDITTTVAKFDSKPFELTSSDGLGNVAIRSFTKQVNVVSDLPADSVHDRIVKIVNSRDGQAKDTYWSKFVAENEVSGVGYWTEALDPTVSKGMDPSTLPHQLFNETPNNFEFKRAGWVERKVGDEVTNSDPTFVGQKIQQTFLHNNRLGILSEDNVCMSKTNKFYDFYYASALTQVDSDPIDINCSSIRPAVLHAVIPTAQGLILFSKNQQFIMFSDAEILTPTSTVIRGISNYEIDGNIDPVDVGTSINFVSKTPSYTRVFTMQTRGSEESPLVNDMSRVVSEWIPDSVTSMLASPQNFLIALYGPLDSNMYLHRTYVVGEEIQLQSWFKWEFPGNIQHAAVDSDTMWTVVEHDGHYVMASASLTQTPEEKIIITADGQQVNPHMDLYSALGNVTYDSVNDLTKCYLPTGYKDNAALTPVLVIAGNGTTNFEGVTESGFTITPNRPTGQTHTTSSPYFEVPNKDLTNLATLYTIGNVSAADSARAVGTGPYVIGVDDYTTNGTGSGATFSVSIDATGGATITLTAVGQGYSVGEIFTITNDKLGGTVGDGVADLTFEATSIDTDIIIGYKYNYDIELPTTYFKLNPQGTVKDYTAALTIARMKFAVGLSSVVSFKLKSKGYRGELAEFTGDGSETDFSVPFPLKEENGIVVKLDGAKQASTTYSVTTTDAQATVKFNNPPAAASTVANVTTPAQKIEITTDTWYDVQPVQEAGQYLADDVPLIEEEVFTLPIHQKTDNFNLRVFSNSPFPVSLSSMMWEGNYSPRFYRRT